MAPCGDSGATQVMANITAQRPAIEMEIQGTRATSAPSTRKGSKKNIPSLALEPSSERGRERPTEGRSGMIGRAPECLTLKL